MSNEKEAWLYRKVFVKGYQQHLDRLYGMDSAVDLQQLLIKGAGSTSATKILVWLYGEYGIPVTEGAGLLSDRFGLPDFLIEDAIERALDMIDQD